MLSLADLAPDLAKLKTLETCRLIVVLYLQHQGVIVMTKLFQWRKIAFALVLAAALTGSLSAQLDTGQITGAVSDNSGGILPGASITIKNTTNGATFTVKANAKGEYQFNTVPLGAYKLVVSAPGFGDYTTELEVTVGGHVEVPAKLGPKATSETVDVSAGGGEIAVNTTDSELGTTISSKQLEDLPSLTRNPYDFVELSGSVSMDPNGSTGNGVGESISGGRAASTEILLDGVENIDLFGQSVGETVPLDAVREFSIITSGFSAEYGRASGGIVNLASRSGGNAYHGTLYAFNRISALTAHTYYEDTQNALSREAGGTNGPADHFTANRFGYSVGGRVYPPLHDKLFFFSSTEWNRVRSSGTIPMAVPTAAFIAASSATTQAFFSQYGALSSAATVGTPLAAPSDYGVAGTAPGDLTPGLTAVANPLEQVSLTVPTNAGAGNPTNSWDTLDRVDYIPTSKTNMFFRYVGFTDVLFPGSNSLSPYVGYNTGSKDHDQAVLASINHIFSTNVVLSTKFAFNRLLNVQPLGAAPVGPTLYLDTSNGSSEDSANQGLPIALPGYLPFSPGNSIPFGGPQNFYQFQPDLTWTIKAHTLHIGGTYIQLRDNRSFGAYENAIEQISGQPDEGAALDELQDGQAYEFEVAIDPQGKYPCQKIDFTATSYTLNEVPGCEITTPVSSPNFTRENTFNDGSVYGQDDWKVTPKLTLNLGLRWEYYGVQHNTKADLESNFFPATGGNEFENIRNGAIQTTPNSPVQGLIAKQFHNFGPRLGFAYDLFGDGKWAFRGGYGISYERNFGNVTFNVMFNPPNYAVVQQIEADPTDPLALSTNNFGPLAGSGETVPLPQPSLRALDPHLKTAYANLYNFSVEHEVAPNTLIAVEYTGSRGVHQYSIAGENEAYFGNEYLGDAYLGGERLNNQYGSINVRESNGDAYYNGVNVRFEDSNFGKYGLQLVSNYTFAKSMDNLSSTFSQSGNNFNLGFINGFAPGLDRGNSDYDARQRVTLGAVYEPKYLEFKSNKLMHATLGGLEFAPILTAQSGPHFTVYDCSNIYGYACPRIEAVHDQKYHSKPMNVGPDEFNLQPLALDSHNSFYNTFISNAFGLTPQIVPGAGVFGVAGSEIPNCGSNGCYQDPGMGRNQFSGPNIWNLDMGVYKNFRFTERLNAQFRGEFYNVLNHHNIYTVPGDADYAEVDTIQGLKGSTDGSPGPGDERRQIQLALKLTF
jgi:outer membrane receptor protein involved in Fe transport